MQKLLNLLKHSLLTPYLIIFIVLGIVFAQTIRFDFTYLDDDRLIINNNHFLQQLSNIPQAFTRDVFLTTNQANAKYYRPLLTVSFMLDAQLGKTNPSIYHLTNIVTHILAVSLLYLLLKTLNQPKQLSLLLALLFGLHPVLTQAVAWIPGRNDSLLAVFVLSSFISFIKWSENPSNTKLFLLHITLIATAFFTKESSVFLPLLLLLYAKSLSPYRLPTAKKQLLIISWIGIAIIWYLLKKTAISSSPITLPSIDSINSSLFTTAYFFSKALIPNNLSPFPTIQPSLPFFALTSITILVLLIIVSRKSVPIIQLLFGLFWFLVFLLPNLINPYINNNVSFVYLEHRLYVPLIGIIVLFSTAIAKSLQRSKWITSLIYLIILFFAFSTFTYTPTFKDELSYWSKAVKTSPESSYAHQSLGLAYQNINRYTDAEKEFFKALELNPQETFTHMNLGNLYANQQKYKQAEKLYIEEINLYPDNFQAYQMLGTLYAQTGQIQKSEEYLLKALDLNNKELLLYQQLVTFYEKQGNNTKANYYKMEAYRQGVVRQ